MKTEINTFIETAITEILQGVASAHEYIRNEQDPSKTGALNPYYEDDYNHSRKELIRDITFDVAIRVEEASEKSGGAKAKIYVVNAGGEYRKKDKAGQISNVKFSVPIVFPITNLKDRPDQ